MPLDKDDVQTKVDTLKAQGKKIAVNLTDEEWDMLYTFPRPTPERMAVYRAKAAVTRSQNKLRNAKLQEQMDKDYETQLDELVPVAILVLHDNMHDPNANIRQKAAIEILNRRHGRPTQMVNITETKDDKIVYKSTVLDAMKEGEAASRN